MNLQEYFDIVLDAGWETCEFYNNEEKTDLLLLLNSDDDCGLHPMGYICTDAKACEEAYEKLSLEDRTKLRECEGGALISRIQGEFEFDLYCTSDEAYRDLAYMQYKHSMYRKP